MLIPVYESRQMTSEAAGGIQCLTHTHVFLSVGPKTSTGLNTYTLNLIKHACIPEVLMDITVIRTDTHTVMSFHRFLQAINKICYRFRCHGNGLCRAGYGLLVVSYLTNCICNYTDRI